ncbi:hypothetical protein GQ53DRAFT_875275 [Thozetella sp. PMI_491]|nr:hypothetical protein GQ53DRAFT_875275 [Thozetella sp. PMI_491]
MAGWKKEVDFTTIDALHKNLGAPLSKYHDPTLAHVEQEILDWFKGFGHFLNVVSGVDPAAGKAFFEMQDYSMWDLMGTLRRSKLEPHYDHITPYLGHTKQGFKDVEIMAITTECGYYTALQNVAGTAADGTPYDFTFRSTSIVRKVEGSWKLVHEHYSFPVDMATKVADTTCTQNLSESVEFKKQG